MLQDLEFGRLDNQYHPKEPTAHDRVVCIRGGEVLLHRDADGHLHLPTRKQAECWQDRWSLWQDMPYRYLFRMQGENYFLYMGDAGEGEAPFAYEPAAKLRQRTSKNICFAVMTAWHLYCWYRNNRYCGCCGSKTEHDGHERMVRCAACGNTIFPRIAPAVIIGVTDGDRLLMSKYANRSYTRYALLAGFIEIGETAEEAVAREVMEEVGLKVKNIRYYKSQPWGIAGNLSIGYFCDLDGDDTIHLDKQELALAQWFDRDSLPEEDDGISLTREMMGVFGRGEEPK